MRTPAFRLEIPVAEDTNAWGVLVSEIPRGASLRSATVVITEKSARVIMRWVGKKPDGTPHQRTSVQSVILRGDLGGGKFLHMAYTKPWAQHIEKMLPS